MSTQIGPLVDLILAVAHINHVTPTYSQLPFQFPFDLPFLAIEDDQIKVRMQKELVHVQQPLHIGIAWHATMFLSFGSNDRKENVTCC